MIENLGAGWTRFIFLENVDSTVFLVGDFNDWDEYSHPLQRQPDGSMETILRLDPGEYEFKYKCGGLWFNDPVANKYVQNCWVSENSVVVVPPDVALDPTWDDVPLHQQSAAVPARRASTLSEAEAPRMMT